MSETQNQTNQPGDLEAEQVNAGTGIPTSTSAPDAAHSEEASSGETSSQEKRVSGQELLDELGRLSTQFVDVAQAAWRSEQRKQLESELKTGLAALARSMEEGFDKVSRNKSVQESAAKARETAETLEEKVSKSKTGQDLAQGLLTGLRSLSQQLDKIADDLEAQRRQEDAPSTGASSADEAQDIPINRNDS